MYTNLWIWQVLILLRSWIFCHSCTWTHSSVNLCGALHSIYVWFLQLRSQWNLLLQQHQRNRQQQITNLRHQSLSSGRHVVCLVSHAVIVFVVNCASHVDSTRCTNLPVIIFSWLVMFCECLTTVVLLPGAGDVLPATGQTPTTKRASKRIKQLATLTPQRLSARIAPANHGNLVMTMRISVHMYLNVSGFPC